MRNRPVSGQPLANDAQLVQKVRSALGRGVSSPRLNVSSCGFVVTLHGTVCDEERRRSVEAVVHRVEGVRGVVNKLGVRTTPPRETCFQLPESG